MFFDAEIRGDLLPPMTLSLTFDDGPGAAVGDGPGPKTARIGEALRRLGVRATFFATGRHARAHPEILRRLADLGHLVANHTDTHPDLPPFVASGGDLDAELAAADAAIRPFVDGPVALFRPPYGHWRSGDSTLAPAANRSPIAGRVVGPVHWDIDAADWDFWRLGASAEACASAYLAEVGRVGRGIVLMHDSTADSDEIRANNRAAEAVEILIPALLDRGHRFVRLDEVPQVRSAMLVEEIRPIEVGPGRPIGVGASGRLEVRPAGPAEAFGLIPVGAGFALRAPGGRLAAADPASGVLSATAPDLDSASILAIDGLAVAPDGRSIVAGRRPGG